MEHIIAEIKARNEKRIMEMLQTIYSKECSSYDAYNMIVKLVAEEVAYRQSWFEDMGM